MSGAAAVVAVCSLAVLVADPALALAALAFLSGFDDYIRPAVIYRDFLVADVVGLTLIVTVIRHAKIPRGAVGLRLGLAALVLFCAFNVISLGPANWSEAVDNVARLFYFTTLVAAVGVMSPRVPLRAVGWALVASLLVRFLYEGWYYFAGSSFVFHYSYQFGAMTSNANTLGGFGACVLPLSCALAFRTSWVPRMLAVLASLLLAGGVFLSYSKGAWITGCVSVAAWFAEAVRRRWVDPRPLVAVAAVVLIAIALVPPLRRLPAVAVARWVSQASVLSNRERMRYITTAAKFAGDHPVLGIGLERFGPAYLEAHQLPRGPDDPHSGYLLVASELGIPALGCFLFVLGTALITAFRNSLTDLEEAPTRLALAAAIAAVLVLQLFSAEPLSSRVCWMILALALAPPSRVRLPGVHPGLP